MEQMVLMLSKAPFRGWLIKVSVYLAVLADAQGDDVGC